MAQSYESHAHRPYAYVVAAAATVGAIVFLVMAWSGGHTTLPTLTCLSVVALAYLATARSYTTALQDRIIRMEMLYRTDRLLSPAGRDTYARLSLEQVIALRFASDGELAALIDRAAAENLDPKAIKRAIKHWQPDLVRT